MGKTVRESGDGFPFIRFSWPFPQIVIIQDEGGNVFGGVSPQHWGQSEVGHLPAPAVTLSCLACVRSCLDFVLTSNVQLQLSKGNSNDGRRPWSIYRRRFTSCFSHYTSCPVTHTAWLSPGAFLFSVVNPHGDPPCAFPLRSSDEPRAICEPKRVVLHVCCCCYLRSSFSQFVRLRGGIRTHIRHRRPRGELQRAPSQVLAQAKFAGGRRHENGTN